MRPHGALVVSLALVSCAGVAFAHDEPAKPPAPLPAPAAVAEPDKTARNPDKAPFELVRSMQALQDQMAIGSFPAQAALPRLSNRIAEKLVAAPPEAWRDPRNAHALIGYLLAGGQARVGRKVLELGSVAEPQRKLLEGALAHVEGQEAKARQLLTTIDPRKYPGLLGAHLALVQATLFPKEDVGKIRHALDYARLLAPGTLIEEAALRREIVLFSDIAEIDRFILLASQYERRFKKSVYADNFHQRFAGSLVRLGILSDAARFERLDALIGEIRSNAERLDIYLMVAQAALLNGNVPVARIAAARAVGLATTPGVEAARATLYEGGAEVFGSDFDAGLAKIKSIDVTRLPQRDMEMAKALMSMTRRIHDWPSAEAQEAATADAVPETANPAARADTAAIDMAQQALAETDKLLAQ